MKELKDSLRNCLAAQLQLCRLLQAVCLHKASCGTYSTAMPCLTVHAVPPSLWMHFLGVHYSCSVRPWELLCKWGAMGRDENPESVEQWDIGFKSFMAISKGFHSWCRAHYFYRVSSTELESNSKSRFVGGKEIQKSHPTVSAFAWGGRR